ncbi:hypothetical protein HDV03_004936, partial [Kappamyces sp. JEL0829]
MNEMALLNGSTVSSPTFAFPVQQVETLPAIGADGSRVGAFEYLDPKLVSPFVDKNFVSPTLDTNFIPILRTNSTASTSVMTPSWSPQTIFSPADLSYLAVPANLPNVETESCDSAEPVAAPPSKKRKSKSDEERTIEKRRRNTESAQRSRARKLCEKQELEHK